MVDAALCAAGNFPGDFTDQFGGFGVIAEHSVHLFGEEIAGGALDQIRLLENAARGGVVRTALVDGVPLLKQHREIADEMARAGALGDGTHDDAHALGDGKVLDDSTEALALLRVVDLAGNSELLGERHENEVAAGEGDIGCDPRSLGSDWPLGDLDDDLGSDRVDAGNVLRGNFLMALLFAPAVDLLEAAIECSGDGIPEVEEGVLVEADVNEHGLEALLDIFDAALEDTSDDVLIALALDGVFLEDTVL